MEKSIQADNSGADKANFNQAIKIIIHCKYHDELESLYRLNYIFSESNIKNFQVSFSWIPSSHSLSTPASRCILLVHANSSACTIVHAAYNAFINVDDQMDFRLYRLMYRLYLASSPRTTISVWTLRYWVVLSENAWFIIRSKVLHMRKLPFRPCSLIVLFLATFDVMPFDRQLFYIYTCIHVYFMFAYIYIYIYIYIYFYSTTAWYISLNVRYNFSTAKTIRTKTNRF